MRHFILFFISFILLSCDVKVNSNQQKVMNENNSTQQNIPFPMTPNYSREFLMENFWKCNYRYNSAPEYWVILPKNVKPVKIEPIQVTGNLINIGQYQTIDKSNYLEVWVFYEVVSGTVQPADWLSEKLKISNESIIHQNIINTSNGEKYSDVLTSKVIIDGEKIISRFTVLKKGSNYFCIKASCNEKDYSVLADKMRHITANWNIND